MKALTNGTISGTGTLTVDGYKIGAVLLTTNNSNAATVTLRRDNATGKKLFDLSSVTTIWVAGPISTEETQTVYYSISGTGATAQLYEWVE